MLYKLDYLKNFDNLVLHTEVRLFSKGTCLERILAVFYSVIDFIVKRAVFWKMTLRKENMVLHTYLDYMVNSIFSKCCYKENP